MKTPIRFLLPLLCAAVASLQSVDASTFLVTNNGDNGGVNPAPDAGTGTLRQAIVDANANAGPDMITFSPGVIGTILLLSALPNLSDDVIISGPGANVLAVDGNHANRVFYINPGLTVTISGLTIINGTDFNGGGGIYNNNATLTVTNSTLSGNSVSGGSFCYGGGIYNDAGSLTVIDSTLRGNSVTGSGGPGMGGGGGGGIVTFGGSVTVTNSTLSGNSVNTWGGGIENLSSGSVTVINSTLSGNSALFGGGIHTNSGSVTVTNSTLSGNSTTEGGVSGGIFMYSTTLNIGSTILNAGASGANIYNDSGTVNSFGYNLSSDDASALLNATGDQNITNPMLGPLANNGGPTFTHALLTGSPAISAGDPSFTPPPDYDQRGSGYPRVVGGRIDIGSFEVQALPPCPQPQGYWKNNPAAWPSSALPMTLGNQTYTKTELLMILGTPTGKGTKADASLILADQLIAAKLNIANGADGTPVTSTITDADAVLSLYPGKLPYRVRTNTTNGHRMVNDANVLNNYNNGLLTSGCTP